VISEFYPSTSKSYVFKKGSLQEKGRPYHVPTYGTIQAVKPDRRLSTYAFSPRRELLDGFEEGQTFLLGKKRTMFQISKLSPVAEGSWKKGRCRTWWLELPPDYGEYFQQFQIFAATMRYIILKGQTKDDTSYAEFSFPDGGLCLPDFYWDLISRLIDRGQ